MGHHSTSDDSLAYRDRKEIQQWTTGNSPIARFQAYLIRKGWWSAEEDETCRDGLRKQVLIELSAAEKRKKPAIDELFTDVYAEMPWNLKEQREELAQLLREHPDKYPIASHVESPLLLRNNNSNNNNNNTNNK